MNAFVNIVFSTIHFLTLNVFLLYELSIVKAMFNAPLYLIFQKLKFSIVLLDMPDSLILMFVSYAADTSSLNWKKRSHLEG